MKGQSNRLQSMDPPDDWVNGSWTVDCICGVNFDDGEEMVNCDECGVWVHTRCSRYVKGDDIFVCDKCKGKNERNDCEETEVAQLLVELPTKTMSMESTYVCNGPTQRPFRLWTDMPIEERVHVHGVPGGDPALFSGLSSLFTPKLWNCTGYVPKKFSFQYREFPCWDEDQSDNTDNEKNENPADKGAGVLFSLSNNNLLATPVAALIGMRSKVGDVLCDRNGLLSEKQGVSEDLNKCAENGVRERSFLRPLILHSGKCKKEDYLVSKDQSGKMKSTPSDKVTNMKKRIDHASKIVFTSMNDEKQSADRDLKHARGDSENPRNKSSRGMVVRESSSNAYDVANKSHENPRYSFELSPDIVSYEISKNNSVSAVGLKEENGVQVSLTVENSTKIEGDAPSLIVKKDVGNVVTKQGGGTAIDYSDDGGFSRSIVKPSVESLASTKLESKDDQIHEDVNCGKSIDSLQTDVKLKIDKQHDVSGGALNFQDSAHMDAIEMQKCNDRTPESFKVNSGGVVCSSQLGGHKVERSFEGASNYRLEKADEQSSNPCEFKQEWDWPEGSTKEYISSLKPQSGSEFGVEKPSKSGGMSLHQHVLPSQHKTTLCVGKSSPASSNVIISKPSISDDLTLADPENLEGTAAKHEEVSGSCGGSRKECSSNDIDRDEGRDKLPRRRIKEHPKECLNAAANSLYSVRDLQDPIPKRNTLHLKDSVVLSTVKTSLVHDVPDSSGYSESIESHLNHKGLTPHSKVSSSCLPQRGDKPNHPPSKVNQRHATAMYPPATTNSPAVLSDEELAFLLHQELNSSPRVPRVPRLRQTGSSPQLGSPNATSMLIKRTSSCRGRDHASASRMKTKDALRNTFRSSREHDDDVKRTDEVLSSPDQRRQEISNSAEASKREENGSPTRLNALKKGLLSAYATNTASNSAEASKREENRSPTRLNCLKKGLLSAYGTNTASSGPSSSMEANDHNNSSIRNSPRNTSDDDTGTVGEGPVHHTLPGLINEIMSKGRRMTYEELCNAVLPHWPNLRKHNGERYAYSSHSQAVLDCLRNRHEWARLVDRGPKTNSSRKRRKFDVEESEDSEYGKGRTVKVIESKGLESQKEEFPKRKRNIRKRRLALQGKGIKDIRKRRKTEMFTDDDDVGLLSDSSDGSMFSEDELQDVDECSERREASGSDE